MMDLFSGKRKAVVALICLGFLASAMVLGTAPESFQIFADATIALFTIFASGNGVEHIAMAIKGRKKEDE